MSTRPRFAIGDRVTWVASALEVGSASRWGEPHVHGVVVYYRHRYHRSRLPRVRWNNGWGYHVKAEHLRHLTPEEAAQWPAPTLFAVDCPRPAEPR